MPGNLIGKHKRLLTEKEERLIADFIRVKYINQENENEKAK